MKRQIVLRKKELGIETVSAHWVVKLRNADAKIVASGRNKTWIHHCHRKTE